VNGDLHGKPPKSLTKSVKGLVERPVSGKPQITLAGSVFATTARLAAHLAGPRHR